MGNIRNKIYISIGIILVTIVLFMGWMSLQISGDKVLKNTYINEVNVGGLSKKEAKKELEKRYKVEDIEISYLDKKWSISSKDVDFSYNLEQTIEHAYNINRGESFVSNIDKTIKSYLDQRNNLKIDVNYSNEKLKKSIESIAQEVNLEVKDADISVNESSIKITPGNSGLNVNVEESIRNIIRQLEKGNNKEDLVVTKVEPNIKKEQLQEVNTLLGSYSTKFNSSIAGRSSNIRLAASKSSDILLMPGDVFSYNEYTGEKTTSNGYKNAPVIVQGVVQEGIGGGVCQVSSTLYNSVLYAGLELVSIKNHSIPSTYVSMGRDATVTDGGIDFIFKNNLKYPVYLKNYVSGNVVTCQIYGSSKDKQNIQISTSTDGVSVAPVKKVEDPTIPKGQEKELEAGRNGYKVSTYRLYINNNGKVIKKEKVATSYYPKKQGVIVVGTMEIEPEQPPIEPEQPPIEPETPPKEPEQPPTTPPEQPETPPTENKPEDTNPQV
ncbi:VanW family protein [Romboutsia sp.]|uniref:VanW family protein n=1 Tax=Romboutsia sp. TaxID=1965302 RepID=UPI002C56CEAB|nr:VanW family protein [Romboutsia sp.]HSQ88249.1 VanW family protein [Romboutsia sp.]